MHSDTFSRDDGFTAQSHCADLMKSTESILLWRMRVEEHHSLTHLHAPVQDTPLITEINQILMRVNDGSLSKCLRA